MALSYPDSRRTRGGHVRDGDGLDSRGVVATFPAVLKGVTTGQEITDPLGLYMADRRDSEGRPWVLVNMVSSADGGTAIDGTSTGLGDDDDLTLFKVQRALPDVILVGAGTVRAEDYGPVRLDEERRRRRADRGQEPTPRLVIVSGRLSLEQDARVFSDPAHPPLVLTGAGVDHARRAEFSGVADVVALDDLDAKAVIDQLGDASVVLCEGGPSLIGQLVSAGLVDEMNLTVSPMMVSGESQRIAHGAPASPPLDMVLDRVLLGDRSLFLRYLNSNTITKGK